MLHKNYLALHIISLCLGDEIQKNLYFGLTMWLMIMGLRNLLELTNQLPNIYPHPYPHVQNVVEIPFDFVRPSVRLFSIYE